MSSLTVSQVQQLGSSSEHLRWKLGLLCRWEAEVHHGPQLGGISQGEVLHYYILKESLLLSAVYYCAEIHFALGGSEEGLFVPS